MEKQMQPLLSVKHVEIDGRSIVVMFNIGDTTGAEATVAVEVDTETSKDLSVSPTQVSERDKQNEYLYSSLGVRHNAVVKTGNAQCESSIVGEYRVMQKFTQRAMQKTGMTGKSESSAAQQLGGPVHSAHKEPTQYFMSDPPTLQLLCLEPTTLDAIYPCFTN